MAAQNVTVNSKFKVTYSVTDVNGTVAATYKVGSSGTAQALHDTVTLNASSATTIETTEKSITGLSSSNKTLYI